VSKLPVIPAASDLPTRSVDAPTDQPGWRDHRAGDGEQPFLLPTAILITNLLARVWR
jgi:hypothetical protein